MLSPLTLYFLLCNFTPCLHFWSVIFTSVIFSQPCCRPIPVYIRQTERLENLHGDPVFRFTTRFLIVNDTTFSLRRIFTVVRVHRIVRHRFVHQAFRSITTCANRPFGFLSYPFGHLDLIKKR